jgi:hypothetical protein
MTDPWGEVSELKVQECPPSTLRNELTTGPREVSELEVRKLETWMTGPPPKFETSSMMGSLGGAAGRSGSTYHRSLKTSMVSSLGVLPACPVAATTEVKDVDGGPLGGATGMSCSGHHQS